MDLLKNTKLVKHAEMSKQEIACVSGAQTLFNIMDLRGLSNIIPIVRPLGFNNKKSKPCTSLTICVLDCDCPDHCNCDCGQCNCGSDHCGPPDDGN